MNLDRYEYYASDTLLNFEFYSKGPNGSIKKVIRLSPRNINGTTYFNIGFGDYHDATNSVSDQTISNNGDTNRILATIAQAVLDFMEYYPDMMVYAVGSTPARTRLYQIAITTNWEKINDTITVFGLKDGVWKPFSKNINYEAFLGIMKKV